MELINNLPRSEENNWEFIKADISNQYKLNKIFQRYKPDIVVNLAAQAGVRYSLENPSEYINSNIVGFFNILECSRRYDIKHFVYASSSSVYGGNTSFPFKESDKVDNPVSLYAATKKSNELIAHSYSHLFKIPCTGLRFFTVYGPWGRPDMAPMIFAKAICNHEILNVYNYGNLERDFTYIDDVVEAIFKCCYKPPLTNNNLEDIHSEGSTFKVPHKIFNVGNNKPIPINSFIEKLEIEFGIESIKNFMPMQLGDVRKTYANIEKLSEWIGYKPAKSFDEGIKSFANWYKVYRKSNYYE